jgi:hypothetical protein
MGAPGSDAQGLDAIMRVCRRRCGRIYRVRSGLVMALVSSGLTGCYQYVPITEPATAAGTEVSLGITDRGRVALTGQVGPGARRLRGRLTQATDSLFIVSLTSVEYLGTTVAATWTGELVSVSRDYVSDIAQRRLSRSRSWLTAGAFALLAAGVSTIAIVGLGGGDPGGNRPPDGGGDQ